MYRVFLTRRIPEPGIEMLRERTQLEMNEEDRVLTREELLEGVSRCDALLCLLTDEIDAEVMDKSPGLKVISNYAVGYNNIDVEAATKRGIPVTNTPGVLTDTTADFVWTLLMAVARRVVEADRYTRAGLFKGWGPMLLLGCDVYGKTLGVVGFGRIGQAVAKRARGFDMRVLYSDVRRADPDVEAETGAEYVSLPELLKTSDYVSLHVPLTEETHHMIGEKELRLMKPGSYLINTARGPVVDEKALVQVLREGHLGGAGLDVFENEPELTPGLSELDNVVLAPHIASASKETRSKMAEIAASNLLAVLEGRRPKYCVNPKVFEQDGPVK